MHCPEVQLRKLLLERESALLELLRRDEREQRSELPKLREPTCRPQRETLEEEQPTCWRLLELVQWECLEPTVV